MFRNIGLLVAAVILAGGAAIVTAQDREDVPEFSMIGKIEKTPSPKAAPAAVKYGYSGLQGAYAVMEPGAAGSNGMGAFKAGGPVAKFYGKVALAYDSHANINGVEGELYKGIVGGVEYYFLFPDRPSSNGLYGVLIGRKMPSGEFVFNAFEMQRVPQA